MTTNPDEGGPKSGPVAFDILDSQDAHANQTDLLSDELLISGILISNRDPPRNNRVTGFLRQIREIEKNIYWCACPRVAPQRRTYFREHAVAGRVAKVCAVRDSCSKQTKNGQPRPRCPTAMHRPIRVHSQ